jgi:hypothetical protein
MKPDTEIGEHLLRGSFGFVERDKPAKTNKLFLSKCHFIPERNLIGVHEEPVIEVVTTTDLISAEIVCEPGTDQSKRSRGSTEPKGQTGHGKQMVFVHKPKKLPMFWSNRNMIICILEINGTENILRAEHRTDFDNVGQMKGRGLEVSFVEGFEIKNRPPRTVRFRNLKKGGEERGGARHRESSLHVC